MKRSRFTEEQIIGVRREQESGMKVSDLCRKLYPDSLKIRIGSCQSLGRRFYLRDDSRRLSRQRIAA